MTPVVYVESPISVIEIKINDEARYFSLLSIKTKSAITDRLNGVQGQLIDQTAEVILRIGEINIQNGNYNDSLFGNDSIYYLPKEIAGNSIK